MTRYVLTHPERGIYLGNAMGLGFWSKLDPVGQTSAVTFESYDAALAHARSWDGGHDGVKLHCIIPLDDKAFEHHNGAVYAPIATCVAAGLEAWDPGPYAPERSR